MCIDFLSFCNYSLDYNISYIILFHTDVFKFVVYFCESFIYSFVFYKTKIKVFFYGIIKLFIAIN